MRTTSRHEKPRLGNEGSKPTQFKRAIHVAIWNLACTLQLHEREGERDSEAGGAKMKGRGPRGGGVEGSMGGGRGTRGTKDRPQGQSR